MKRGGWERRSFYAEWTQSELEKGVVPLKTKMYSHCNLLVRENKRQLKRMKGAKAKTGRQKEDWLELLLVLAPTLFKGVGWTITYFWYTYWCSWKGKRVGWNYQIVDHDWALKAFSPPAVELLFLVSVLLLRPALALAKIFRFDWNNAINNVSSNNSTGIILKYQSTSTRTIWTIRKY